jgi:hypothetical protein
LLGFLARFCPLTRSFSLCSTAFDKLANVLLEKEVLSFDDVKTVLGPRQWEFNPLHEEYMKMRHPEPPAAATAQQ